MKKVEIKTYEMGESLLPTLVFLVFGIFLMTEPVNILKTAMYILGGVIALIGVFNLLIFYKTGENKKEIINGGVYIIIGMVTILCVAIFYDTVEMVLRWLFAIYLLYVGINRLVSSFKAIGNKTPYFINSILIILIAILLVAIPGLPLIAVGAFITGYAVVEIVGFIFGKKNSMSVTTVKETVEVTKTLPNKEENNEEQKLLK